jgi:hypothetical protein
MPPSLLANFEIAGMRHITMDLELSVGHTTRDHVPQNQLTGSQRIGRNPTSDDGSGCISGDEDDLDRVPIVVVHHSNDVGNPASQSTDY